MLILSNLYTSMPYNFIDEYLMAEREGFETSFLKNDTAYIVGSSGSQKSEHIYPHINTYKHTSKGGGFTVERYI